MLRHSKRCLTQRKPASLASCRSRAVVAGLPHRKTWMAGSVVGTLVPGTAEGEAIGLAATGDGVGSGGGLEQAPPMRAQTQIRRVANRTLQATTLNGNRREG